MSKKCLVTGGAGFIGSNLSLQLLEEGYRVDVIDDLSNGDVAFFGDVPKRVVHASTLPVFEKSYEENTQENLLIITGDFADKNVLERISNSKYDYVFHLAARPRVAYSVEDPVGTTEVNLFKTVALFKACVGNVKRVIFSSSSSVFGDASEFPTSENHSKNPRSPYALQKLCGEHFANMFKDLYGLDIVSLRYFNVYGPHQYGDSPYATAIGSWCHATKEGNPLRSDGDGTQVRDLTYVGDVVAANICAAQSKNEIAGMAFNIGYGEPHSNNSILEVFKEKFDNVKIMNAPWRPGDVMKTHADITSAKEKIGYNPQTDIAAGLQKTFEWWGLN